MRRRIFGVERGRNGREEKEWRGRMNGKGRGRRERRERRGRGGRSEG